MEMYSKLLTMAVSEMIGYVSTAKEGIEKIEKNYNGFFSLQDKTLQDQVNNKDSKKEDDMDPLTKLTHKEREIKELKNELNHLKIQLSDVESDLLKTTQKEKMFRTKLSLAHQDTDNIRRDYEIRISEFKQALYEKDEESTKMRETIKNLEKQIRDHDVKVSGGSYELESTKKKLNEAKHHQDMLTKKVREYEEVVRVINQNLKKNSSQTTEANINTKHKLKEVEKYKMRFRILEDELHKREDTNLSLRSTVAKLTKDLQHKGEEIDKMIARRYDQSEVVEMGKKNKDYESQIEVLKEMIVGLKAQIKAKEMDGYRQETKIVSLQSQVDAMRAEERKLHSIVERSNYSSSNYSPANINKQFKANSGRNKMSRESARAKPLIKSTPKVSKGHKDIYEELHLKSSPMKQNSLMGKGPHVQSSKPNILVGGKTKSYLEDDSDE